jgi:hypothetical protein
VTLDGVALSPARAGARLNLRVPKAALPSGGSTLCIDATSGWSFRGRAGRGRVPRCCNPSGYSGGPPLTRARPAAAEASCDLETLCGGFACKLDVNTAAVKKRVNGRDRRVSCCVDASTKRSSGLPPGRGAALLRGAGALRGTATREEGRCELPKHACAWRPRP